MQDNTKKQKSKSIKMIVIGFAGPIVLLIVLLVITSALNFVMSNQDDTGSLDISRNILNVILLFVGIITVSGFVWGPILGIFGIVKLSKLSRVTQEPASPPESDQGNIQSTVETQDNNNQIGGNNVT